MHRFRFVFAAALAVLTAVPVLAQPVAQTYEILGVTVEGVESEADEAYIISVANLRPGTRVALPSDEAFGQAVRKLYRLAQASDAEILVDRVTGTGVFLTIRVEQQARLGEVTLEGQVVLVWPQQDVPGGPRGGKGPGVVRDQGW